MSKSYLERTLKMFKEANFEIQKVEYFNAYGGNRVDLFGFIDAIAIHPHHGTIGVQACGQDWNEHIRKMTGPKREILILWLASGNRCFLIGWRNLRSKDPATGRPKGWTPRIKEFTLAADFPEITPSILSRLRADPNNSPEWLKRQP
jgi:hypothetical protein